VSQGHSSRIFEIPYKIETSPVRVKQGVYSKLWRLQQANPNRRPTPLNPRPAMQSENTRYCLAFLMLAPFHRNLLDFKPFLKSIAPITTFCFKMIFNQECVAAEMIEMNKSHLLNPDA